MINRVPIASRLRKLNRGPAHYNYKSVQYDFAPNFVVGTDLFVPNARRA
jgi:hypothetical protein